MLSNKKFIITGLANKFSIASGIAKSMAAHGAELLFLYQNERFLKKIKPIAIIISLTIINYDYLLMFGFIDLPKNLKKSLSGDKTSEVSPPIKAFS